MDCRQANSLMQAYLNNELELRDMAGFVSHLENCKKCSEELEIRLLVGPGIDCLDEGKPFDLKKEYNDRLSHTREVLEISSRLKAGFIWTAIGIGIFVLTMAAGIIIF